MINDNFTIEENNIIFNETLQLLLKIDSKITLCSQQMYTTTEGLYIVEEYQNKSTLIQTLNFNPRKLNELNTINDLIIADSDFKTREILLIDKLINQNMCKIQQTMINSFRSHIDTYHMIQIQGNQLIIYSTGQNIYIPTCQPIKEIKLIEQTQNCYNDQPIKFTFNNQTRVGYLTSNLIIKDTSYIKLCNLINDLIILPNSNRIIERQNNKIKVISQTNENILKITLTAIDTGKINFKHNPQIAIGIDIISMFQNIVNINDTGTILKIIEDGPTTLLHNKLFNNTGYHNKLAYLIFKHLIPYMIVFALVIILKVIFIYCLFKYICKAIRSCCQNRFQSIDTNKNMAQSQSQLPNHSNDNQLSLFNKFKKYFKDTNKKYNHPEEKDIELS